MQKSRKMTSKSSSIRTVPVMRPSARSANRRSSAASAISGAAVANAVYNACGARVRAYPITLDKVLPELMRREG